MTEALNAIANGAEAYHERLDDLTLARLINKVHGGPVITAMEVSDLDDTWIDVMLGVAVELPRKQRRQNIIRQKFAEFERSHPTYGKRFEN